VILLLNTNSCHLPELWDVRSKEFILVINGAIILKVDEKYQWSFGNN